MEDKKQSKGPSHISSIGFQVKNEKGFSNLATKTIGEGNRFDYEDYSFHQLEVNDGIELIAVTKDGQIWCFKPYFKGTSSLNVTVSDKIHTNEDCEFCKYVTAYPVPEEIPPILFEYVYVHDLPSEIDTSKEYQLHLTAFANGVDIYEDDEEFRKENENLHLITTSRQGLSTLRLWRTETNLRQYSLGKC